MYRNSSDQWLEENQKYLTKNLARLRQIIKNKSANFSGVSSSNQLAQDNQNNSSYAVELLCTKFRLSPFERDILLLCAGLEFESDLSTLCAQVQGDLAKNYVTFSLALSVIPDPNWDALLPINPLRHWHLIEIVPEGHSLTNSCLQIDERILHYLLGTQYLDQRLKLIAQPIEKTSFLVTSHQNIVKSAVDIWVQSSSQGNYPIINLYGMDGSAKKEIAAEISQALTFNLFSIESSLLPQDTNQFHLLKTLCEREWILGNCIFILDCDNLQTIENTPVNSLITRWVEIYKAPLIITSRDRRHQKERSIVSFEVVLPTSKEQYEIWQNTLDKPSLNHKLDEIISNFSLSPSAIETVSWQFKGLQEGTIAQLWQICRQNSRPRLEELAQRIDSKVTWQDLILAQSERETLKEIAIHVRQRTQVYEKWGFGAKNKRGLGISALFAGASGTGKTLAAEVLSNELNLDVYRIDISSVVSKYIGETEKNLRKIFDIAEGCGAILLFDEADALFGKRSEVKDSHDRYANMEVSYLLQRIEAYRGLAILTTNLKESIDQAFMRRIRFTVEFSFPDASQREQIWQIVFPSQTPIDNLDFKKLAKLNVTGGNIRNIAMNAAFLAAQAQESVQMKHILQAAKSEYVKLERPLTDTEIKGWV